MADLILREATFNDLEMLDEIREDDLRELHLDRLKNQEQGHVTYIIAFDGQTPVGSVLITYKNSHGWHRFPAIEDLYVKDSEREKGVAKQLMVYAEDVVRKKHHPKICLDVETHEKWIRKFYESIGYRFVSGVHELRYTIRKEDSVEEHVEHVNYFEKDLDV